MLSLLVMVLCLSVSKIHTRTEKGAHCQDKIFVCLPYDWFCKKIGSNCRKTCGLCNTKMTSTATSPQASSCVNILGDSYCAYATKLCDLESTKANCQKACKICSVKSYIAPTTAPTLSTTIEPTSTTSCNNIWGDSYCASATKWCNSDRTKANCQKACKVCSVKSTITPTTAPTLSTTTKPTPTTLCNNIWEDSYCATATKWCNLERTNENCQKACKMCSVKSSIAPTTAPINSTTIEPTSKTSCNNIWGDSYCASATKWCNLDLTKANCQKTCGACNSASTNAPVTTARPLSSITYPQTTMGKCKDKYPAYCEGGAYWLTKLYCKMSIVFQVDCAKACGLCSNSTTTKKPSTWFPPSCKDKVNNCEDFTTSCATSWTIRDNCKRTCGLCSWPSTPRPANATTPAPITDGPIGSCGVRQMHTPSVVAGDDAMEGDWPWQALLFLDGNQKCGGSVLAERWILTAAHCVFKHSFLPNLFTVRVAEHNTSSNTGQEEDIGVEKIIVHTKWNYKNFNFDIALIKLKKPLTWGKFVQPICLPDNAPADGSKCFITGWGRTSANSLPTSILQQAMLPVVDRITCFNHNKANVQIPITDHMLCAGYPGTKPQNGCKGDSGGPLAYYTGSRWELIGVVSFGSSKCDSREAYTVFANIASFKPWIHTQMQWN